MKQIEERLEQLETIAETLRTSDISLDEAVKLFEEGMKLSKGLEKDLKKIESKVQILVEENEDETPKFSDFDDDQG